MPELTVSLRVNGLRVYAMSSPPVKWLPTTDRAIDYSRGFSVVSNKRVLLPVSFDNKIQSD